MSKVQEASSTLGVAFALSKWPHLHRAYLVTVREYLSQSVSLQKTKKSPYWEDSKEDTTPSCDNDCKGGGDYDVCAIDVENGKYEILRYKNPCRAKCAGEVK